MLGPDPVHERTIGDVAAVEDPTLRELRSDPS